MDFDIEALRQGAIYFIVMIASLALHEWGHAAMADKLGDDTPRSQGRVTLNPLAHIDPIGTVLIPLLGALGFFGSFSMIGWAKPVYTNPSNFRNRTADQAWVTIAGPGMNLILALGATVAAALAFRFFPPLAGLCRIVMTVNIALLVFNLLPIPPLDGSKFLMYWFGMSEETYARIALWGSFALLLLINLKPFRLFVGRVITLAHEPFFALLGLLT